jgi:plasmid stabilization system protein ParE
VLERYRIVILPEASSDLSAIFNYIEKDSSQTAASVATSIIGAIDSLEKLPHRFKIHRADKNPDRVVHAMSVRPFIIYYRVLTRDQVVEILTIRRGTRRQPRSF